MLSPGTTVDPGILTIPLFRGQSFVYLCLAKLGSLLLSPAIEQHAAPAKSTLLRLARRAVPSRQYAGFCISFTEPNL
jgi:hypothetical protein